MTFRGQTGRKTFTILQAPASPPLPPPLEVPPPPPPPPPPTLPQIHPANVLEAVPPRPSTAAPAAWSARVGPGGAVVSTRRTTPHSHWPPPPALPPPFSASGGSPHGTTKTAAVRKRRADQATPRPIATSEIAGSRCGRGSRAPCSARARLQNGCGRCLAICHLELQNIYLDSASIRKTLTLSHSARSQVTSRKVKAPYVRFLYLPEICETAKLIIGGGTSPGQLLRVPLLVAFEGRTTRRGGRGYRRLHARTRFFCPRVVALAPTVCIHHLPPHE